MKNWPIWWSWDLEFSPHMLRRMLDREGSEVDLRRMIEDPTTIRGHDEPGRWFVETFHEAKPWEVIVAPDPLDKILIVITAYPRSEQ